MLLRDFRRPCPCCTDCYYPPLSALLGPTHGPWRSKKPLPCYFHDPPPDGTHPATQMRPADRGLLIAVFIIRTEPAYLASPIAVRIWLLKTEVFNLSGCRFSRDLETMNKRLKAEVPELKHHWPFVSFAPPPCI